MRYYEDPAAGRVDPAKFSQFSGTHELAPGAVRKVFAEGDKLCLERNGKREQLFPETPDIFFQRRDNEDIVWAEKDRGVKQS